MADRPRGEDWWLASDGKWYPPELHPGSGGPVGRSEGPPEPNVGPGPTDISRAFTYATTIGLMLASSLLIVSAYYGFRVASELRAGEGVLFRDQGGALNATSNEIAFSAWFAFAILAFVVTGIITIVWTFQASRVFDRRGATGRRWRGGWTIGSWFIPFANLVLPKFVFNELERLSVSAAGGGGIGEAWRTQPRSTLADLWWALWVAGVVVNWGASLFAGSVDATDEQLATGLTLNSIGLLLIAGAGVAFLFVIRRIAMASVDTQPVSLPEDRF